MSRGPTLFGHPLHPATTHLPIGFWTAAVLADGAALLWPEPYWWPAAFWALAAGLAAAVVAVVTGFVEYAALPPEHPAQPTAMRHLLVMLTATMLFGGALILHRGVLDGGAPAHPLAAGATSGGGLLLLLVGGWLGGEMVYRHRVGTQR